MGIFPNKYLIWPGEACVSTTFANFWINNLHTYLKTGGRPQTSIANSIRHYKFRRQSIDCSNLLGLNPTLSRSIGHQVKCLARHGIDQLSRRRLSFRKQSTYVDTALEFLQARIYIWICVRTRNIVRLNLGQEHELQLHSANITVCCKVGAPAHACGPRTRTRVACAGNGRRTPTLFGSGE